MEWGRQMRGLWQWRQGRWSERGGAIDPDTDPTEWTGDRRGMEVRGFGNRGMGVWMTGNMGTGLRYSSEEVWQTAPCPEMKW